MERIILGKVTFPSGGAEGLSHADFLPSAGQEFPDPVETRFLGEAEIANRFGDVA